MKRGFTILFIELFCVQASLFLGALLQEYALFCQIMLLFFLALTYRRIYLLARRSLKNAQEEAKFQALQKQEQLQKEQEQLFVSRKQETLAFQQATIRKLQTLQNYLKTNEYNKIQDYLPAITDDFQRERFHPICQDSLINAILADKRFLAMQKNIKVTYEVLLPEKSNIPSSELSSIFFNLLDNGIESCSASGSESLFISVTSKMSAGFLTVHMQNSKDPARPFNHKTSKKDILNHGFGLSIIEDICEKNDGSCQWIDNGDTFETVVLLSKGEVDSKKIRVEFSLEDMDMSEFRDGATYPQIKEYVLEHTGLKVSNLYISQIKRKCGIGVGKNYNLPKSEDSRQPQCPQEKEKAIREAFKYFGMI